MRLHPGFLQSLFKFRKCFAAALLLFIYTALGWTFVSGAEPEDPFCLFRVQAPPGEPLLGRPCGRISPCGVSKVRSFLYVSGDATHCQYYFNMKAAKCEGLQVVSVQVPGQYRPLFLDPNLVVDPTTPGLSLGLPPDRVRQLDCLIKSGAARVQLNPRLGIPPIRPGPGGGGGIVRPGAGAGLQVALETCELLARYDDYQQRYRIEVPMERTAMMHSDSAWRAFCEMKYKNGEGDPMYNPANLPPPLPPLTKEEAEPPGFFSWLCDSVCNAPAIRVMRDTNRRHEENRRRRQQTN